MSGYTRQSVADIIANAVIKAAPVNAEFNALRDAFAAGTGHKHDNTTGQGGYIPLIADLDGNNRVLVDTANNRISVFVEVSGVSVEQIRIQDGAIVPVTDNDIDLGTSVLEFKNLFIDGTAKIDTLTVDENATVAGTLGVTGLSTLATVNVDGGTIDGTVIGATTPAAITGTTITASSLVGPLTGNVTGNVTGNLTGNVVGNITSTGTSTFSGIDVNGGTIDNTVIGNTTAQAITGTNVTATTGLFGTLTGDVTGNLTGNSAGTHTGAVVGNITGNVTASSGTSTFTDVTINGTLNMNAGTTGTITGLSIPVNTTDAATKTYVDTADALKLNLSGGTMSGAIAMGTNKITGLGTPTASTDAATKGYVDTSVSALIDSAPGALDTLNELAAALGDDPNFATTVTTSIATKVSKAGDTMTGNLVMGANKVTSTTTPTTNDDLTRKGYVDTQDALKLSLTGGTMSGAIAMGTSKITGLGDPTLIQDAATKNYVDNQDALKLSLSGGTMTGGIVMGANKVTSTATPTADDDLTRKGYIDTLFGSTVSAADSAAAAAVSESNAAGSASAASTSATNASNSADAAAASYDSFDDRYLGAKSSAPTLDNDGDALLTGALFFNTSLNQMFVWNGSAWQSTEYVSNNVDINGGTIDGTVIGGSVPAEITASQYNSTEALPDIKPSLNLDFANTKKLDPRITFTRGSTAAYYDGVTFAKAEENLLIRSQEFNNAGWSKLRVVTSPNADNAPDGTTTAESITLASGQTLSGYVAQASSVVAEEYVISVYAKPNGKNFIVFRETLLDGTANDTWFNVSTGAIGTTDAGHTATISASTNGYYRCSIKFTANATRGGNFFFFIADTDGSLTVADDGNGIYLWGAQLEQRDALTDYTPTTDQPITNYIPALQTAASGEARFDHDPITGESKGLLIEEQRTNLVTYSEQFDDASWGKTSTTVTSNIVVAPDGTLTGDKLIADAVNPSLISRSISVPASSTNDYYPTCYVKAGSATEVVLNVYYIGNAEDNVTFNMVSGEISGAPYAGEAVNEDVGNGWRRIGYRITRDATGTRTIVAFRMWVGGSRGAAVVGAYHYVWGAQLEVGQFPTSYIRTVASQVTRSPDAASMTGTNFSSWYRQDEGTVFVEGVSNPADINGAIVELSDGTGANRIFVGTGGNNTSWNSFIITNNVGQATINPGVSAPPKTTPKLSVAFANNDGQSASGGILSPNDASVTLPVISQIQFGSSRGIGSFWNYHIKKLAYYPKRLSNQTLQALTEE